MDALAHTGNFQPVGKERTAYTARPCRAADPRLPVVESVEGAVAPEGGVRGVVAATRVVETHDLGGVADPAGVKTAGGPVNPRSGAVHREAVLSGGQGVTGHVLGAPDGASCSARRSGA